jgi:hypothetical protein
MMLSLFRLLRQWLHRTGGDRRIADGPFGRQPSASVTSGAMHAFSA